MHDWPNSVDWLATAAFVAVAFLLPALGYVFMVADIRAYYRSLRRTLVRIGRYVSATPEWAHAETPRAIAALGLQMPCTEEELKHAYRNRVKDLHPDHGGDQRRFMALQAHFEEALTIIGRQNGRE